MIPDQHFYIDAKKDNILEGDDGTILICPKGCFKNSRGKTVEDTVKIVLSEAISIDEMILSNLTTTSNGQELETDGVVYFNATSNGQQLKINEDIPVHIEIPSQNKKSDMMVYNGTRDEKGNMNWIKPKKIDNSLLAVDISTLDFFPEYFRSTVKENLPFRNYKTASQELIDSLYYSFSISNDSDYAARINSEKEKYNSPNNNKSKRSIFLDGFCEGINPAWIKMIKSPKYQNTFIATRGFEARMKTIFASCERKLFETYINNLDKNMYELDSLIAYSGGEKFINPTFYDFFIQRLTNVKFADRYSVMLKEYYKEQFSKINEVKDELKENVIKAFDEKNKDFEKTATDYKNLLLKRERYRMESYGFNCLTTGWINIGKQVSLKTWTKKQFQITVKNEKQYDRIYAYIIYPSSKSLCRLNTNDNQLFFAGSNQGKKMMMPANETFFVIIIGFKGDVPLFGVREFYSTTELHYDSGILEATIGQIKKQLKGYHKEFGYEQRILNDLHFMSNYDTQLMIKRNPNDESPRKFKNESEFISRLHDIVYPCSQEAISKIIICPD